MGRLAAFTFSALSAVSLILCVATGWLWARSYDGRGSRSGEPRDVVHHLSGLDWTELGSVAGELYLLQSSGFEITPNSASAPYRMKVTFRTANGYYQTEVGAASEGNEPSLLTMIDAFGFRPSMVDAERAGVWGTWERGKVTPPSFSPIGLPDRSTWPSYSLLRVPHGVVVTTLGIAPVAWALLRLVRIARHRRRVTRRLCAVCGYDLRASHGRCPECGMAMA